MTEPELVIVGEALIDLVEEGDDEPRLARPGGSPYNVAVGLARLGRHAAYVGRISHDPLGTVLRRHAERSGVDLSHAVDALEPSTVALVELHDNHASYQFGVEGTADFRFTDAELAHAGDNARLLHFGSLTSWTPPGDAALARMVDRVRRDTLISYDPNVRPQLQRDTDVARRHIEASLSMANLVKASEEDLAFVYPGAAVDEVAARWIGLGPDLVVVTRGGDGCSAFGTSGRLDRPVAPAQMVDTVGAGDAFMSGLLDGLVEHDLLDPAQLGAVDTDRLGAILDQAALVAAVTCSRAGANPPRRSELPLATP